jgi:hypothetical protein
MPYPLTSCLLRRPEGRVDGRGREGDRQIESGNCLVFGGWAGEVAFVAFGGAGRLDALELVEGAIELA